MYPTLLQSEDIVRIVAACFVDDSVYEGPFRENLTDVSACRFPRLISTPLFLLGLSLLLISIDLFNNYHSIVKVHQGFGILFSILLRESNV